MEAVKKANQRMRNYPLVLSKCAKSGAAYAACVTKDFNVAHKACDKEFVIFQECLKKAAMEMKTKL